MRSVALLAIIFIAFATHAPPAESAHCSARGARYAHALAAKAEARAHALAAARRAEARERARRREAAQIAYFSRMYGSNVGRWYPLVHRYFPGHEGEALYVMHGESGGSRYADNGVCRGLWQIHEIHAARFLAVTGRAYFWHVFEAEANAEMTSRMSKGGTDWSAWQVRP